MVSIYVLYTTSMVVYTPMYTIVVVCSSGLVVSVSPSDLVLGDVEVYLVPIVPVSRNVWVSVSSA